MNSEKENEIKWLLLQNQCNGPPTTDFTCAEGLHWKTLIDGSSGLFKNKVTEPFFEVDMDTELDRIKKNIGIMFYN